MSERNRYQIQVVSDPQRDHELYSEVIVDGQYIFELRHGREMDVIRICVNDDPIELEMNTFFEALSAAKEDLATIPRP